MMKRMTIKDLYVDGGATANNLPMQLQADILGTTVVRPAITETTPWGCFTRLAWLWVTGAAWMIFSSNEK